MTRATEVVPFCLEHLWSLDARKEHPLEPEDRLRTWKLCREYERAGPCFTLFADGQVVTCAGVAILSPNVGTAWMIGSDLVRLYRFSFQRVICHYLESIIKHFQLRRVQTVVSAEFETSRKWLERIGFRYEGTMAKAGLGGEDQHVMARMT